MPTPEQVIGGYQQATKLVRQSVLAYATTLWGAQSAYRDSQVDEMVSLLVPRVQAGQLQVANLTSSYIASVAQLRGRPVDPVGVERAMVLNGRGVDPEVVYRRPAKTLYTSLSKGAAYSVAVDAGAARLASIVLMDLQMAKVRQADASMASTDYKYFRRVLTGNEDCALCVIASTQRYTVGNLLPIHPGCDCDVDALDDDSSPELVLDSNLLETTHGNVDALTEAADRGGRATDYRKLIVTREHGEQGPSLRWRDQKFTGPDDI